MLRFFRLNDPYRLLGLLLILIAISLPLLFPAAQWTIQELKSIVLGEALNDGKSMYIQLIDDTAPLAAWFAKWTYFAFGRSITARHVIALLVIFFQASYFAILLITNKAYNENTYLPALIFGILAFFSFDLLSLSPELLAATVLLFALNNLFKEIEFKIQRDEIILNLGVYLGVASLLVFSYSVFLLGALLLIILFTRITFRKTLLLIFGFLLPHAVLFTFFFFWNNHGNLIDYFYAPNFSWATVRWVSINSLFILAIIPVVYLVFSLVMLNRERHFTKYQSQLLQVMFIWLLITLIQLLFSRELTPHSFYPFIPPLAYFISHYLLLIRRKRIAETVLWIFMVGILTMNWVAGTGRIKSINYSSLLLPKTEHQTHVKNQRILVLEDGLSFYKQNKMAGYFLSWPLSKEIFGHPEYFENVILVGDSFQKDPPQTIVDKNDLMKPFFERIPHLKKQYRREGDYYYRINN